MTKKHYDDQIEIISFSALNEGKHVLILSSIHGNEQSGTQACKHIISELKNGKIKLKNGKITFIPICNPKAHRENKRYIDVNLNRVMKFHDDPEQYEEFLANQICPIITQNDIILDLHSTAIEGDKPFVFLDKPENEIDNQIVNALPVEYVLEGWPDIYKNTQIQDYSTDTFAHQNGKNGITVECGSHNEHESINVAYKSIYNVMVEFNLIDGDQNLKTSHEKQHIRLSKYIIKEKEGHFVKTFNNMEFLGEGSNIIEYDNNNSQENHKFLKAPYDCFILMNNPNAKLNDEWYYLGVKK